MLIQYFTKWHPLHLLCIYEILTTLFICSNLNYFPPSFQFTILVFKYKCFPVCPNTDLRREKKKEYFPTKLFLPTIWPS